VMGRHTLGGAMLFTEDAGDTHYPFLAFLQHSLHQGRIPLWNPFILCGQSFSGHTNTPIYYPANYLVYWLRPDRYIIWHEALHMAWGGLGMWSLARRWGLGYAWVAGLLYSICSPIVSDVERYHIPQILGWAPWFLAWTERSLERAWWMGPAALVLG